MAGCVHRSRVPITDATPTLVGASGELIASIGGMDSGADGSVLLLANDNNILFTINKLDGLMTPAGDVDLNVSALSHRVPPPAPVAILSVAGGLVGVRRRRTGR